MSILIKPVGPSWSLHIRKYLLYLIRNVFGKKFTVYKNSGHKHIMNVQIMKVTFSHLKHCSNLRYSGPVSFVL